MKKQITLFVDEDILKKIDEFAKKSFQSRSAFMILSSIEKINGSENV